MFAAKYLSRVTILCALSVGSSACTASRLDASTQPQAEVDAGDGFVLDFVSLDGDPRSVTAEKNTDVLVFSFWKTTCEPCKTQLADFDVLHQRFESRGLRMYAVNIDSPKTRSSVRGWVDRRAWGFDNLADPETQVVTRYNPRGECPFYAALSADGRVLRTHGGYVKGEAVEFASFLDERLPSD